MNDGKPDSAWMALIDERLAAGDERMRKIETELTRNTDATTEVLDLLTAAKGAFRVFGAIGAGARWVGGIAAALIAVWGLLFAITHGGRPPGGP
jgi:hypothetical protein